MFVRIPKTTIHKIVLKKKVFWVQPTILFRSHKNVWPVYSHQPSCLHGCNLDYFTKAMHDRNFDTVPGRQAHTIRQARKDLLHIAFSVGLCDKTHTVLIENNYLRHCWYNIVTEYGTVYWVSWHVRQVTVEMHSKDWNPPTLGRKRFAPAEYRFTHVYAIDFNLYIYMYIYTYKTYI